ncbi:hypothetical protein ACPESV_22480 [Streptomyces umbrinus]
MREREDVTVEVGRRVDRPESGRQATVQRLSRVLTSAVATSTLRY